MYIVCYPSCETHAPLYDVLKKLAQLQPLVAILLLARHKWIWHSNIWALNIKMWLLYEFIICIWLKALIICVCVFFFLSKAEKPEKKWPKERNEMKRKMILWCGTWIYSLFFSRLYRKMVDFDFNFASCAIVCVVNEWSIIITYYLLIYSYNICVWRTRNGDGAEPAICHLLPYTKCYHYYYYAVTLLFMCVFILHLSFFLPFFIRWLWIVNCNRVLS